MIHLFPLWLYSFMIGTLFLGSKLLMWYFYTFFSFPSIKDVVILRKLIKQNIIIQISESFTIIQVWFCFLHTKNKVILGKLIK